MSTIFLLDPSAISLSLSLFDWANYKNAKGAVKIDALLDYDGNLPAYVNITNGKTTDKKRIMMCPYLPIVLLLLINIIISYPYQMFGTAI